jgi:hypothetical protein
LSTSSGSSPSPSSPPAANPPASDPPRPGQLTGDENSGFRQSA